MAGNNHQLVRHRTIDNCLQQKGRLWNWESLAAACGEALRYYFFSDIPDPSRRTIMGDINIMKHGKLGYYAPIEWDRKEKSFYYTNPKFSIMQASLSPEAIKELENALLILQQYRGFEKIIGLESITTQLEYTLLLQNKKQTPIIQFDHPLEAPGQQYLNHLFNYIRKKKVLQINYHPFNFENPYDTIVSPYLLKEYNKRWNLIAYRHETQRVEVLPLDRINSIEEVSEKYIKVPEFHLDNYFKEVIGATVLKHRNLTEVRIIALPEQSKYIKTKPIHSTQKIVKVGADGSTVFSYQLIPNYELESLLLSYGEKIRVLRPIYLRNILKKRLHAAYSQY